MNNFDIDSLTFKSGVVSARSGGAGIMVSMTGELDLLNPEQQMGPFFSEVHVKSCELEVDKVVLNLEDLAFLNSSGIKVLIIWIMKVVRLSSDRQYKIQILGSTNHEWQLNSVPMLRMISPELVTSNI